MLLFVCRLLVVVGCCVVKLCWSNVFVCCLMLFVVVCLPFVGCRCSTLSVIRWLVLFA